MANIRIDLVATVINGQTLTFKSPVDCSHITGLIVYYPEGDTTTSKAFLFADAHGNNVGSVSLFAENVLVKVILDTELNRAYVQNADTNAYLEGRLDGKAPSGYGYGGNAIGLPSEGRVDSEAELETALQSVYAEMASTSTKLVFWNGYPADGSSQHGWFGILTKSSENNGGFFGWSACDSGTTIRKVKFSGAWQPLETMATTANVNAKPAMDALWYNESVRSTFAAQKVNVDLSKYNYIAIIPNYNDDATRRGHIWVSQCPSDSAGFLNVFKANDATMASRHVTKIETNGITFSDASVSIKGAAGTTNNKYCVPLQIFGIKVG